jgi:hypothetical protein
MSQDMSNPALDQLFRLIPGTADQSTMSRCQDFVRNGGTVFDLLDLGARGIVDTFNLHLSAANVLLEKATVLAVSCERAYRERQLVTQSPPNPLHRNGIRARSKTPTFDQFNPDWENSTPSQSPDANNGPNAYLVRLCKMARDLEKSAGGKVIKVADRRPDIEKLRLDPVSLYQIKPTVALVNEVLEEIIKASVPEKADYAVDDLMLDVRFPFRSMPFEWYHRQWSLVLKQNGILLGAVVRTIDPTAPYFTQPGAHGSFSDVALRQSCDMGPLAQSLLTENFLASAASLEDPHGLTESSGQWQADVVPTPAERFIKDNFGTTEEKLKDSVFFCDQVSIDARALTQLFSIEDYATTVSKNQTLVEAAGPQYFGSVFINNGQDEPLGLTAAVQGSTRQLTKTSFNRFERINRMLRLARWLKLTHSECDRLVVAAIRAEQRKDLQDDSAQVNEPLRITNNTLRAIGLFQEFRELFGCSAEDFSALINEISIFSQGKRGSQFDRIFNDKAYFDTPLILDNGSFLIDAPTRADQRTVDQICSALGLNQEAWRYLSRFIAKSHNLTTELQRSLPILSSFYRFVKLASLLQITPIELGALLETISARGAGGLLQKITGESRISVSGAIGEGDVLSVMQAIADCVLWCRENDLSVIWLVRHVAPVIEPPLATAADINLLDTLHKRLQPVLFSEEKILQAGVPPSRNIEFEGWLHLLEEVVNREGLVLALADNDDEAYERLARGEIEAAVAQENLAPNESERVVSVILALLLQIKAAQSAVVQESLSVYLDLPQDLTLPLLKWVNQGGVSLLLTETSRALNAVTSGSDKVRVGDEVLNLLAHLVRRAAVVQKLGLSSAMLVTLTTGQNWKWFGLRQAENLTLHTLYNLTLYQRAVMHTEQPAEKLLDYLRLVNSLPAYLTPDDVRLIRDSAATQLAQVLKWGVGEVLECILYLSPTQPVVRDLTTLDTLLRIRGLAVRSGLGAKAIIELGKLTPDSHKDACRRAAEHLLESLSESSVPGDSRAFGEMGQSSTAEISCIGTPLIANMPNQIAMIELTVRDLTGKPYVNVTVRWSCDRPGLLDEVSYTDDHGRAVARFKAGSWMGIARVKAQYGLQQVAMADVLIDCDEATLGWAATLQILDRKPLAGGIDFIPVEVQLVDTCSPPNPGVGRTVEFAGRGISADNLLAVTDEQGFARTKLTSMAPVEKASLLVRYSTIDPMVIGNITFVDSPYIQSIEPASMAVVGSPLQLLCRVTRLDQKPAPGVSVTLKHGGVTMGPLDTDENGIALFTVENVQAGSQTFTGAVEDRERSLTLNVAKGAVIHGQASEYQYPVAGSGSPTLLWVEVKEEASNQARPIANCSIKWEVTPPIERADSIILTNEQGRSTFPFEATAAGKYTVTASRTDKLDEKVEFSLEAVPAREWSFTWFDTSTPTNLITEGPLRFIRGHDYQLDIDVPQDVALAGARAMLSWIGDFSAKGLGMNFTPLTGAYVLIAAGDLKLSWKIKCDDVRNGSFDLTFFCNRLDQRLVLPGRLDAPPPVLDYPKDEDVIEVQPLLRGTGSALAEIYVFEGRDSSEPLARTSVNAQGTWSVRLMAPLASGAHVLSVKQRHYDTTEAWALDANVTVTDFIAPAQITSPPMNAKVGPSSWVEGLGLPGADVRVVSADKTKVLAKGVVAKDGTFRIQFAPQLATGETLTFDAAFYVGESPKSGWLETPHIVVIVDRG